MDKAKYEKLINLIMDSEGISLRGFIEDYKKPKSRATAAKCLMPLGMYKDALELLLSINENDIEDKESWIQVLSDIGICYSNGFKEFEGAMKYFKMALNIAEKTDEEYLCIVRGELWGNILETLNVLNRKNELQSEIEEKLRSLDTCGKKYRYNSYIFYSNYFLALHEDDIKKAKEYLFIALNNFELRNESERNELLELSKDKEQDQYEVFKQMESLIRSSVIWDI
ncbi:hypothetical protein K2F43_19455 [Clostridium estertheticum]|uniref:hypothetical protein n=1 Tax=Clostridium estertheticum TaxID=238834 RepID=UPI001C6EF106|nr:hypothetical protein [Clostridium estertheticum]MBW9173369.1 hypothetical protein [Clostridium estertheticum]WLC73372.1 hypothetical protein KTC99_11130 [Clostridium estertheticum]